MIGAMRTDSHDGAHSLAVLPMSLVSSLQCLLVATIFSCLTATSELFWEQPTIHKVVLKRIRQNDHHRFKN